ncbi:MAG: hypothetical protein CSB47_10410 [Proteobacteria bacterium]|nr:MAG: hypothetical protein CSB47_10410 [Pseudomonadota bacterium]
MSEVTERNESNLAVIQTLPSLKEAEVSPVSMVPTYLDVDELEKGFTMRCFYGGLSERDHEVTNTETGEVEVKTLKSVIMISEDDGDMVTYESAASVLVSTLEEKERQGLLTPYKTAFQLKFLGKKKNKTNGNSSARWDVRLLRLAT